MRISQNCDINTPFFPGTISLCFRRSPADHITEYRGSLYADPRLSTNDKHGSRAEVRGVYSENDVHVKQLIAALSSMPSDAKVELLWDGMPGSTAELVWLAKNGNVIVSDFGELCFDDDSIPVGEELSSNGTWTSPQEDDNTLHG